MQEFLEETEEKFPILEKKVHQIIDEIKCEEFLEDLQILGLVENSVENSIRKQENEME